MKIKRISDSKLTGSIPFKGMKTTEIYQISQVVPNYSTKERKQELHICQVAEVVHWHGGTVYN